MPEKSFVCRECRKAIKDSVYINLGVPMKDGQRLCVACFEIIESVPGSFRKTISEYIATAKPQSVVELRNEVERLRQALADVTKRLPING